MIPLSWRSRGAAPHRALAYGAAVALPLLVIVALGEQAIAGPGVLLLAAPVLIVAALGGAGPGLIATLVGAAPAVLHASEAISVAALGWIAGYLVLALAASVLFERARTRLAVMTEDRDQLRADRRFQQSIAELAGDCAWQGRVEGDRLLLSRATPALATALGVGVDEVNARGGWTMLVHDDDRAAFVAQLRALATSGRSTSELRYAVRGTVCRLLCELRSAVADDGAAVVFGVVRDVTARHELVEQLRESNERHEATVMAAGFALVDVDCVTRKLSFGGNCVALLGLWPAELAGSLQDWLQRVHADDARRVELEIERGCTGQPLRFEYRVRHADGRTVTIEHVAAPRRDGDDAPVRRLAGFLRDVGGERRLEAALRQRDAQHRFALQAARAGAWPWDYDARAVVEAEVAECPFGLPMSEDGHPAIDRIAPADRERVLRAFIAGAEGRAPYDVEFRVAAPGSAPRWVRSAGRRLAAADGEARFAGVTFDVTEDRRAAEQLERAGAQIEDKTRELETLFDLAPIGLGIATDRSCDTIIANEALAAMLGGAPHGNVSLSRPGAPKTVRAWVDGREVPPSELPMQRAAASGRPVVDEEHELRFADGRTLVLLGNAAPLFDRAGEVRGCIGAFVDVTEQRRLERELQQRLQELKLVDRRKDEFLATLAHELRNPLAPIRNASMLLGLQEGNAQSIDWVRRVIDRQTDHMARLIDDLLDVSRLTQDKLTLRLERVELERAVANAVDAVRSQLDAQRHRLTVQVPPGVWLQGDPVRLTQVFANLLNNAVKYTSPGGAIELAATADDAWVAVTVRDNGVGIPPDQLPHVFEMFYQVDRSIERAHAGLGIGLTLVERLVHMHGGSVVARSEGIGRGSEFTVRLPLADRPVRAHAPAQPGGGRAVKGLRILVADDSVDSALTLTALLSAAGHEVEAVHDGFAALQRAAEFRPHVLVLDIGMPGLNGYDTCRRIRAEPWGRNAVIIAVTGWGADEDRRRSREAGFDAHLVKPVDYTELQKYFSADNIAL